MLEFLNQLGGAVQQYQGYRAGRKAQKYGKMALQMTPDEIRAAQLLAAYSNPESSSLVKLRTQQEYQQAQEALMSQIREQRLADRRGELRGQRQSFFDPERADQTIDYLISRGAPAMMSQARQNVLANLLSEANNYNAQGNRERDRINRAQEFYTNKAAGLKGGPLQSFRFGDILGNIVGQKTGGTTDQERWSNYNTGNLLDSLPGWFGQRQMNGPLTRQQLNTY